MDLTSKGIGGKPAAKALDAAGIELNFNTVPFDQRKPFDPSGLRIGTAAVTTRGMTEGDMDAIAGWIDRAVSAAKDGKDNELETVAAEIRDHCRAFPIPGWHA